MVLKATRMVGDGAQGEETTPESFSGMEMSRTFKKQGGWGLPGGAVAENLPANGGDMGSSPGLGRSHMPRSN